MPKNPKRPFRLIKRFLQTDNFKNFRKKSRIMPKNPKRDPLGSLNAFYKPTTSKIFGKKSHSAEKKPNGGPFGLPSTFGNIKKLVV